MFNTKLILSLILFLSVVGVATHAQQVKPSIQILNEKLVDLIKKEKVSPQKQQQYYSVSGYARNAVTLQVIPNIQLA